ncbi:MAG: AAA family ATPase [Candidatus Marinamargulisbacteria bacterium]
MNQTVSQEQSTNDLIKTANDQISILNQQWQAVIVGQHDILEKVLVALLANGHVLLEGVPGLAKTLIINTLAQLLGGQYKRIQFTPDLLPSDITGTQIYNTQKQSFDTKKGPLFAQFILADEINRAPAKVQSALLESMQERQVTIGNDTYKLPAPFFVLATQNPLDQDGTYPLPEAQMDRFIFKTVLTYPTIDEEKEIIKRFQQGFPTISNAVMDINAISNIQQLAGQIYIDEKVSEYVVRLITATRQPEQFGLDHLQPYIRCGASPRATIAFITASKAYAFLQRRNYVIPEDIKHLAYDVLRHRLNLTFAAEAESMTADKIIETILGNVEVP